MLVSNPFSSYVCRNYTGILKNCDVMRLLTFDLFFWPFSSFLDTTYGRRKKKEEKRLDELDLQKAATRKIVVVQCKYSEGVRRTEYAEKNIKNDSNSLPTRGNLAGELFVNDS